MTPLLTMGGILLISLKGWYPSGLLPNMSNLLGRILELLPRPLLRVFHLGELELFFMLNYRHVLLLCTFPVVKALKT
ncbi:hypothetical protein F4811DRAFT_530638 [Daldinia bambusicola]|nr:hypothetical protein F4811DRAFT_530638 [Daldinia bambusicola]